MHSLVGIDEVGRGCWAGPLVTAAVILDPNFSVSEIRPWKLGDSKSLSKAEREIADVEIRKIAAGVGLGWISPRQVDALGLTKAIRLAMLLALRQINVPYSQIIIDGQYNFLSDNSKTTVLIKADSLIPEVSAASIVAKVARDRYMTKIATKYPLYQFEKHVGYGTKLHRERLKLHGVCNLHQLSYKPIKAILENA